MKDRSPFSCSSQRSKPQGYTTSFTDWSAPHLPAPACRASLPKSWPRVPRNTLQRPRNRRMCSGPGTKFGSTSPSASSIKTRNPVTRNQSKIGWFHRVQNLGLSRQNEEMPSHHPNTKTPPILVGHPVPPLHRLQGWRRAIGPAQVRRQNHGLGTFLQDLQRCQGEENYLRDLTVRTGLLPRNVACCFFVFRLPTGSLEKLQVSGRTDRIGHVWLKSTSEMHSSNLPEETSRIRLPP